MEFNNHTKKKKNESMSHSVDPQNLLSVKALSKKIPGSGAHAPE